MRNVYELEVRARCPVHEELTDSYQVRIETTGTVMVEKILEFFKAYETRQVLQEVMAAEAFEEGYTRI
jgi:hypothetical protein